MRKTPRWYDDEVERHAKLVLSEGETQEQALVSLRMLVRDDHREFGNAVLDDYSAPKLATAVAVLRSRRAAELRAELAKARAQAQVEVEQPVTRIASMQRELATLEPPADPEWDLHRTLFPDFPFRSLRVTPERYEQVHKMTRHQLEAAEKMLKTKTGNAIKGAEDERRRFYALYDKVHPLMQGDDTVADVERRLAAELHQAPLLT